MITTAQDSRAAKTDASTPSIYLLIAEYWLAYDFLMDVQDDGSEQEMFACKRLTSAEVAVCAYVPTRAYEARVKADFINRLVAENAGMLDKGCVAALLATLPSLYVQEVSA